MDIRRSINTRMWSDEWVEKLNPTEKLLWIYLLTNSQTNMLGIYEISLKRISFDTGLKSDQVSKCLESFERVKKAFYFKGYIILTNWIKNQAMNPNMVKSAEALYNQLSNDLKNKLLENNLESFESLSKGLESLPNPSEKGNRNLNGNDFDITNSGWINDEPLYKGLLKTYPKLFKMKSPLKFDEHKKLVEKFTGKDQVKLVYSAMQNRPDLLTKYESAYLTANNWLSREVKK